MSSPRPSAFSSARRPTRPARAGAFALCIAAGAATAAPAADPAPLAELAQATAADLVEMPLEDLLDVRVSTASRFEQSVREAPSTVHVITAEDIRAFGWRTLGEALGSLPGLFVGSDRSYSYLGASGFLRPGDYGSRMLLLVDGHRLNEPIYEQATVGYEFPVDMALVERIEYVAGPGSSVFGSNAFFGVINVVTRSGAGHPGAQLSVEAGSGGHRRASARYAVGSGDGQLLVSASAMDVDGDDLYFPEFDSADDNGGVAVGLDHERTRRLFVKAGLGGFGVSLVHSEREKGAPTAPYMQRFNDPRSRDRDAWTLLGAHHRAQPSETVDTGLYAQLGRYEYRGDYAYDVAPGGLNRDVAIAHWVDLGAHMVSTAIDGHKLLAGIDARWSSRRDQYNYDQAPRHDYLADEREGRRVGVMLEDEIALRDDTLLNAGLRYDHDAASGGNFSPRFALIRHWSGERTLKLIHGSAYRSPNAYEMYYHAGDGDDSGSQLANPGLQAERIHANEIVWSQRLGPRTLWQASAYRYRVTGLITQVAAGADGLRPLSADGPLVFRNADRADATGVELSAEHGWNRGALLRASYGHVHVDAAGTGAPLNAPERVAALNLRVPFAAERLLAGLEARYVGRREGELAPVDAYTVAHLTLTWRVPGEALELQGGVRNLFDRSYADPAGPAFVQNAIEQDGRTLYVRATFGF